MLLTKKIVAALALVLTSASAYADLSQDESRILCLELGLTPESVAALGLNSSATSAMLSRIAESETSANQLRALQEQQRTSRASLKLAKRSVRLAGTDFEVQQLNTTIDTLTLQLQNLDSQIELLQDQIRDYALPGNLDPVVVERVCEPEGFAALVSPEYRTVVLVEDNYAELLPALAAEQMALANNEQLDTNTELVLSRFRNLPAVQTARSFMLVHLDSVRNEFNQQ